MGQQIAKHVFKPNLATYSGADNELLFVSQRFNGSCEAGTTPLIWLTTSTGAEIPAAHLKCPSGEPKFTILLSHGNMEDLGIAAMQASLYAQYLECDVFLYEYTGYGIATGVASEENCYADIRAAYMYLVEDCKVDPLSIILFGRSLGTGPTVWLGSSVKVGGIILVTPFLSCVRTVQKVLMTPPFDMFPSVDRLHNIRSPVLVIHGRKDEVVPFEHGHTIYRKVRVAADPLWIDDASHNNIERDNRVVICPHMERFLDSVTTLREKQSFGEEDEYFPARTSAHSGADEERDNHLVAVPSRVTQSFRRASVSRSRRRSRAAGEAGLHSYDSDHCESAGESDYEDGEVQVSRRLSLIFRARSVRDMTRAESSSMRSTASRGSRGEAEAHASEKTAASLSADTPVTGLAQSGKIDTSDPAPGAGREETAIQPPDEDAKLTDGAPTETPAGATDAPPASEELKERPGMRRVSSLRNIVRSVSRSRRSDSPRRRRNSRLAESTGPSEVSGPRHNSDAAPQKEHPVTVAAEDPSDSGIVVEELSEELWMEESELNSHGQSQGCTGPTTFEGRDFSFCGPPEDADTAPAKFVMRESILQRSTMRGKGARSVTPGIVERKPREESPAARALKRVVRQPSFLRETNAEGRGRDPPKKGMLVSKITPGEVKIKHKAQGGPNKTPLREAGAEALPETTMSQIKFLRLAAAGRSKYEYSNSMLLKFLRGRKFDVNMALKNLLKYESILKSLDVDPTLGVQLADVECVLRRNYFCMPNSRDHNGHRVLFLRPALFSEAETNWQDFVKAIFYVVARITDDEEVQRHGFSVIADLEGWAVRNFSTDRAKELLAMLQNGFPARIRSVTIVDAQLWFLSSWFKIRSVMSQRNVAKWRIKCKRENLRDLMSATDLPDFLGGHKKFDIGEWIAERRTRTTSAQIHRSPMLTMKTGLLEQNAPLCAAQM